MYETKLTTDGTDNPDAEQWAGSDMYASGFAKSSLYPDESLSDKPLEYTGVKALESVEEQMKKEAAIAAEEYGLDVAKYNLDTEQGRRRFTDDLLSQMNSNRS